MNRPTHRSTLAWNGPAPRIVAGVISGTSADGVSAVVTEIRESKRGLRIEERSYVHRPYPDGMRAEILANSLPGSGTVETICRLDAATGMWFAGTVKMAAKKAGLGGRRIDLIGSHGQTVHHLPKRALVHGLSVRSTLQIGDPSIIAQETGIPTVGDFRAADMAVGGEGAPLAPFLDFLSYRSDKETRLLLNLGGIANVAVLPRNCRADDVSGFDTGPSNMIIDALSERFLQKPFDRNGATARKGMVHPELLAQMMNDDFLRRPPPKSTGREDYGAAYVGKILQSHPTLAPEDFLATATEFTALSIYDQYVRFVRRRAPVDAVYASGGGLHNGFLMERLRAHFASIPVRPAPNVGFSADAKEAVLFAVLAWHTVLGRPSNLPRVTGARRPVILGKICLP